MFLDSRTSKVRNLSQEVDNMAAKNPRMKVGGVTENKGDIRWHKIAEKREKSLKGKKSLSHGDVWK